MAYVDGFVIPVPRSRLEEYRQIAVKAGAVWKEYGALEYRECVSEDLTPFEGMAPFGVAVDAAPDEAVIFSWITYHSRQHRDEVNAKVMQDPRISMEPESMPFDASRMRYGGFEVIVDPFEPGLAQPVAVDAP
jgi:uncharacterized protein YbaA (DUF1428 family)